MQCKGSILCVWLAMGMAFGGAAQEAARTAWTLPRVEVTPLPHDMVSMTVDGVEKTRWHHGADMQRPFFHPFTGPSGISLTRMGHPGAPNHDHHDSVWFAHVDVDGVNFWANNPDSGRIRQKQWLAYEDGAEEAIMAVSLGWEDAAGVELMEQEVLTALRPLPDGGNELEIQTTLRPPQGKALVRLGKTNFGLLAVRVAKSLSAHFGGGVLTSSEGASGEPAIFGQPARWVDYSGPVAAGNGAERKAVTEGVTYFDHPGNPRYPTRWHVRADGWMGASFCLEDGWDISAEKPLTLRYLLHAHGGGYDAEVAAERAKAFAVRPAMVLEKTKGHAHFRAMRGQ